ncbi:MAG: LPS assembly lipoprotein LptE [Nevskiales bacterium]
MRNFILVLTISLFLSGCGFHLQGSRPLPAALSKINIDYPQNFDVVRPVLLDHLQAEAESRGGWVVNTADTQTSTLRIKSIHQDSDLLTVSGDTVQAIETLLTTAVEFELTRNGEVLVEQQRVAVFREIFFDRDQIIAIEHESEDVREAMQEELARMIFLRIETQLATRAS